MLGTALGLGLAADNPQKVGKGRSALIASLVSAWNLDGQASDQYGTNHLAASNGPTYAVGKVGSAIALARASSQYLSIASNASLRTGDIDFTVAAWVRLAAKAASMTFLGKWGAFNAEYELWYSQPTDRLVFTAFVDGESGAPVSANTLGSPSINTWYYVVVWHDAAGNTINIQVDNGTVDAAAYADGITAGDAAFAIGGRDGQFLDGRVDEVSFWKRTLSAGERTSLYASGAGLAYPFA